MRKLNNNEAKFQSTQLTEGKDKNYHSKNSNVPKPKQVPPKLKIKAK